MVFRCFSSFYTINFVDMQNFYLTDKILTNYIEKEYEDYSIDNSGIISSKILELTSSFVNRGVRASMMLISSLFLIILISFSLFYFNPSVTICIFILFIIFYIFIFKILSKRIFDAGRTHVKESKNRYRVLSDILGGFKEFKISNKSTFYKKIFNKSSFAFF